jgi:hypothetical protein
MFNRKPINPLVTILGSVIRCKPSLAVALITNPTAGKRYNYFRVGSGATAALDSFG